jgi:hypothetical protein
MLDFDFPSTSRAFAGILIDAHVAVCRVTSVADSVGRSKHAWERFRGRIAAR